MENRVFLSEVPNWKSNIQILSWWVLILNHNTNSIKNTERVWNQHFVLFQVRRTNIIILTIFINFYVCFCNKPRSQKAMVYLKLFSSLRNGEMRLTPWVKVLKRKPKSSTTSFTSLNKRKRMLQLCDSYVEPRPKWGSLSKLL